VASKTEREPQGGEPLLKRRCGESNKRNLLLDTALVLAITNRASPLYSQNKTGKNSSHNSARVLAWRVRTVCASGKLERRYGHDAIIYTICTQSVREIVPFGAAKFALRANEIAALPQLRKN